MECALLVWMLSLNREVTLEEYNACYEIVKECAPHANVKNEPANSDTFRQLVAYMMPLLMMRHRRIPRARWKDFATPLGKHYIQQSPSCFPRDDRDPNHDRYLRALIGYSLGYEGSLVGMAMVQGREREVVNIGIGVKQLAVEPRDVTVNAYVESLSHKLTKRELTFLRVEEDNVILRRLCILLALKQSYIRAIGQPLGFDWSRLEFDVPNETATGDGTDLAGWEFRIFKSNLGVMRRGTIIEESYQCVTAFYRGFPQKKVKFIWQESTKDLEGWVQFINIDQMIKVIPKLLA